jgi:hypothetical protein
MNKDKKIEARHLLLLGGATIAVLLFFCGMAKEAKAVTVVTDMEGTLVKGSTPEVYFLGSDSKRYLFTNEKIFYSWYQDFSSVQTKSDQELAASPIGGTVAYRPGARLIKVPEDPKVYAITEDAKLRWIETEEVAREIFGDNWAKQVDDVSGSLFTGYTLGAPIATANDYSVPAAPSSTPGTAVPSEPAPNTETPAVGTTPPANDTPPSTSVDAGQFAFSSVDIGNVDSKGKSAEDIRSFQFSFNQPYTGGRLDITEKASGAAFYSAPFPMPASAGSKTVAIYPDDWTAKLKSNTSYAWHAVAYAALNATAAQTAEISSVFTTADFTTHTLAPDTSAFRFDSVNVESVDAQGQPAEDVRTFKVVFSAPAKGVRLIITETASGATFLSQVVNGGAVTPTELTISPGDWTAKLKPSTAYTWKVVAYAAVTAVDAPYQYDVATGEFTTTGFTAAANGTGV